MNTVLQGHTAPDFTLPDLDGALHSLSQAWQRGPVLLVFLKVSCPVCQFALPFAERIFASYGSKCAIWAVSQDDARDSRDFNRELEITFPTLLDAEDTGFAISNLYGLTNVPTVLLLSPGGAVKESFHGFDRNGFERIAAYLAKATALPPQPVFVPGEAVPDYKPG